MKPCPFCGWKRAELKEEPVEGYGPTTIQAFVECGDCKARGPAVGNFNSPKFRDVALSRWEWNGQAPGPMGPKT